MKDILIHLTRLSGLIAGMDLDGVGDAHSRIAPQGGGNSMNWVVGHLVNTFTAFLKMLGGDPVWTGDEGKAYARGASGNTEECGLPWERLLADLQEAQKRTLTTLKELPEERWIEPAPFSPLDDPDETLGTLIGFMVVHQTYHTGQLGILRRVAGLEGAIK